MEPTNAEIIFWVVALIIAIIFFVAVNLPWNDQYDPKADDPYRYCPKEEEEW